MKASIVLLPAFLIFGVSCKKKSSDSDAGTPLTVKDMDGNTYNTVKIGTQLWMKENLKTTKLNDNTPLTEYKAFNPNASTFPWTDLANPQMLFQVAPALDLNKLYPFTLPVDYYGAFYNRYAIQSGKIAIKGWRLPTQQDFLTLKNFVASQGNAGNEATVLKSKVGWSPFLGNGSDLFGFDARPAGSTTIVGGPDFQSSIARFATSVLTSNDTKRIVASFGKNGELTFEELDLKFGLTIRLIKE